MILQLFVHELNNSKILPRRLAVLINHLIDLFLHALVFLDLVLDLGVYVSYLWFDCRGLIV